MDTSPLTQALDRFTTALADAEHGLPELVEQPVLQLLLARDTVQEALAQDRLQLEAHAGQMLALDARLRGLTVPIANLADLPTWRASLKPAADNWWWFFEKPAEEPVRFNWLWDALSAVFLTVSISMVVDFSSRLLKGTPDTVGTFTLISQGLLMTATAGGVFTRYGREWIDKVLLSLSVPVRYWTLAKAGLTLAILIIVLSLHLSMPLMAHYYNNKGLAKAQSGHITSALANYQRALALYQDYPEAHYNLALLYEDLQQIPDAKAQYLSALQGGLDAAYNNLARLRILEGNYSDAVVLLINGLDLTQDAVVRYDMLKNLAWARVLQGRYAEAETYLQAALELDSQRAPVYCLWAQIYETRQDLENARQTWNNCLTFASMRNPDEDAWIGMARQFIEKDNQQP